MVNFNEMEDRSSYEKQVYQFDRLARLCQLYGEERRAKFGNSLVKECYWKVRYFLGFDPIELSRGIKRAMLNNNNNILFLNEQHHKDVVYPEESLNKAIENNLCGGIDELVVGLSKYCLVHDDFLPSDDVYPKDATKSKVKIMSVFRGLTEMFRYDKVRRRGLLYLPIYNDITGKLDIVPKVYENF